MISCVVTIIFLLSREVHPSPFGFPLTRSVLWYALLVEMLSRIRSLLRLSINIILICCTTTMFTCADDHARAHSFSLVGTLSLTNTHTHRLRLFLTFSYTSPIHIIIPGYIYI